MVLLLLCPLLVRRCPMRLVAAISKRPEPLRDTPASTRPDIRLLELAGTADLISVTTSETRNLGVDCGTDTAVLEARDELQQLILAVHRGMEGPHT
jgi:hypothetical protein